MVYLGRCDGEASGRVLHTTYTAAFVQDGYHSRTPYLTPTHRRHAAAAAAAAVAATFADAVPAEAAETAAATAASDLFTDRQSKSAAARP